MKKVLARVLLLFVSLGLCVMPVYAFLPAAIAPIVYGGGASAGTAVGAAAGSSGAAAWGLLLGAGFAFIGLSDTNGNQTRVPLTSDPTKAVPAPDAPSTASLQTQTRWVNGGGTFYTFDSACAGMAGYLHTWRNVNLIVSIVMKSSVFPSCIVTTNYVGGNSSDTVYSSVYVGEQSFSGCPVGYVVSGSSCVLSNPRAVSADHNCDYTRAGSALAVLSDVDCGGGAKLLDCNADGSVCSQTGSNPVTGQPRTIEIRTSPGGGSTIIQRDQRLIDNTTVTDSTVVSVSSSGSVDSVAGETTAGSLPAPGTNPTGTPVAPQQPVTINFPNDYARTGEAQTAANTITPKLDTLHHDFSDTVTVNDPVAVDPATMPTFGNTFDNLKAWQVPVHASTCPAPSIDLSGVLGAGKVYQFNAHCQIVQDHFAALQAAMMVCWSVLALFVVLRA